MDIELFLTVFATVFVAELGDKTQLATLLLAAGQEASKLTVFLGAALALVLTTALGVLAGTMLSHSLNPRYLHLVAGFGFIGMGFRSL